MRSSIPSDSHPVDCSWRSHPVLNGHPGLSCRCDEGPIHDRCFDRYRSLVRSASRTSRRYSEHDSFVNRNGYVCLKRKLRQGISLSRTQGDPSLIRALILITRLGSWSLMDVSISAHAVPGGALMHVMRAAQITRNILASP